MLITLGKNVLTTELATHPMISGIILWQYIGYEFRGLHSSPNRLNPYQNMHKQQNGWHLDQEFLITRHMLGK